MCHGDRSGFEGPWTDVTLSAQQSSRAGRVFPFPLAQDKLLFDNSYFKDGLDVEFAVFHRQGLVLLSASDAEGLAPEAVDEGDEPAWKTTVQASSVIKC